MSAADLDSGENAKVIMDTIIWSTTTKIILLHKLRLYKDNFSLWWYQWWTPWMNETIFGTSSEVFGNPRFSSEIFCNIRTFSKAETFVWPSDNVWRVFRKLWKMDGNLRKIAIDVVFSMFFSCSILYHTRPREISSCIEQSKINSISTGAHVLLFM